MRPRQRRRVLVIQWARLGDLFHTRPLCEELKRLCPLTDLSFSCDARYSSVVEKFPEVDTVLPVNLGLLSAESRTDIFIAEALSDLVSLASSVGHYDSVYNVTNNSAAIMLAGLCGTSDIYGYGHSKSDLLVNCHFHSDSENTHIASAWQSLANLDSPRNYPISLTQTGQSHHEKQAAVICDAGSPLRSFKSETIEAIIEVLLTRGFKVMLLGSVTSARGCSDSGLNVVDKRGDTSLDELRIALSNCSHVIGPDTGALHYATALGCNVFGIYLDLADPRKTGPLSYTARTIASAHQDSRFLSTLVNEIDEWLDSGVKGTWTKESEEIAGLASSTLSIIITEYRHTHYADQLLNNLNTLALPEGTEVIVMSSGMDTLEAEWAIERANVISDCTSERRSFAEACNTGAQLAKGDWLLFLNDDCEISATAFLRMWESRSTDRIIAPRLRYWDNTTQSAGFRFDGERVVDMTEPSESINCVERHGVSAAAMLVSRTAFKHLGGFDKAFINGYEDVDFCLRANNLGIPSEVVDCDVLHYRGSSEDRYDHDDRNLDLLCARWRTTNIAVKTAAQTSIESVSPILILGEDDPNSAGVYLRWRSPLQQIGFKEECDFSYRQIAQLSSIGFETSLFNAKHIIVFRLPLTYDTRTSLSDWKNSGSRKLQFDCDDILLNRFRSGSVRSIKRWDYEESIQDIVNMSDVLSGPNDDVLGQFGDTLGQTVCIPTPPCPEHIIERRTNNRRDRFTIGYAGSQVHKIDFALITPMLESFLEHHDDAWFYWWGAHPGPIAFHPRVRCGGPWLDHYPSHLTRVQAVDVDLWLAPLNDTAHNRARSPIKAYEYVGMLSPCLFSNVGPFRQLLSQVAPEFLVENDSGSWRTAMEFARDAILSESLTPTLSKARDHVMSLTVSLDDYRRLFSSSIEIRELQKQHVELLQ